jgi:hypothetical protein
VHLYLISIVRNVKIGSVITIISIVSIV